jgi:histidine triad (HIT) family protein
MLESACVFCKIARGEIPATKVYEDDQILAFNDISPASPTHILLIPRKHYTSLSEFDGNDKALLGELLFRAKELANELGLEKGYRLAINTGIDGGQTVFHLHIHLLGGRSLRWPPV